MAQAARLQVVRATRPTAWLSVGLLLAASACNNTEYIPYDGDPIVGRPIGGACTADIECADRRCVAGSCTDGSCGNDDDCQADELCVFGACEPADNFACHPDESPILSLSPGLVLDFGEVILGQSAEQTVTLTNIGTCLLTVQNAGIDQLSTAGFACSPCDVDVFPQRIPPQRSLDIVVSYAPTAPGDAYGTFQFRTDDATAGDDGLVNVQLAASYNGTPSLSTSPTELNFGYVPYIEGVTAGTKTEFLELTNKGSGNASLVIERLFMDRGVQFTIPPEFANVDPDAPLVIPPFNPQEPDATTTRIPITFVPTANLDFTDSVFIRIKDDVNHYGVEVSGSALGPPQIDVSETDLIFKEDDNTAYPVGFVAFRQLTVSNSGQSALSVGLTLGGEAQDFKVSPTFLPPIPAGGSVPLTVFFNPSGPSDGAHRYDPIEPFDAVLNITSNDTDPATDVLRTVNLKGFSKAAENDQVLKLEMEFQNADNGWSGNDFRDVDLELSSPVGFTCTRPHIAYIQNSNGTVTPTVADDYCEEWSDSGLEGKVNWIAIGQYEEPERIILYDLGPTTADGGVFTARVFYQEDCADMPTGLFADILGIGGSILLGALGGAIGVPIAVSPEIIADAVSENCFDHAGSTVTLRVSLDGEVVATPQVHLNTKGDFAEIAHLRRVNGQFCDPGIGLPCP